MEREEIVSGVSKWVTWWAEQRREKLRSEASETMAINPFLMPFLFDYHDLKNIGDLSGLIIASHLMTGHNTGFGKLVDEKILPHVFKTQKLDREFRRSSQPFEHSCFDEIDHVVIDGNGKRHLLCLKAGRWTIQLTMAVQLNAAFNEIFTEYESDFDSIVVGVFYGRQEELTDKYDILRGINRGANHSVVDLTAKVNVLAGKNFWSWLSGGNQEAGNWVLEGILKSLSETRIHQEAKELLSRFQSSVVSKYKNALDENGSPDWYKLLQLING